MIQTLGEFYSFAREQLLEALAKPLIKAKILDWARRRNPAVTAEFSRVVSAKRTPMPESGAGELAWRRLIDCLSLFVRSDSAPQSPTKIIRNPNFMREAAQFGTVRRHT